MRVEFLHLFLPRLGVRILEFADLLGRRQLAGLNHAILEVHRLFSGALVGDLLGDNFAEALRRQRLLIILIGELLRVVD